MENQTMEKENTCDVESPDSIIIRPKPLCLKRRIRKVAVPTPALKPINQNIPLRTVRSITSFGQTTPLNPFRCNDKKRKREVTADEENSLLWRWTNNKINENSTNTAETCDTIPFPSPITPSVLNEDAQLDFSNGQHFLYSEQKKEAVNKLGHKDLPVDWSLKTRIRLSSTKPFPWRSIFKTSEEASGTTAFARCLHNDCKKRCTLDSSHGAKFYQNCLVWMHPHLPWLNMFPRMGTNVSKKITNPPLVQLDNSVKDTLHSNWCLSFRSLYQLLRTNQCPYFYLCAPSFTVLFRSGGVASILDLHAMITPTTIGLRRALKSEGVGFTMPLNKEENVEKKARYETAKNGESDVDLDKDDSDDEGIEKWLDDLGITKEYLPLVNKSRNELEKEKFKHIDNRPESLVFVERSDIQALVNFLLNSQACMDRLGAMAGIPPTLLSPTAFLGATLQAHKISSVAQNQKGEHMIELHGPILPNTVHSLCSLLNSTQDGNFSAVLTHHPPTLAFSTMSTSDTAKIPSIFATENLKDCGLPNTFVEQMCSKNTLQGGLTRLRAEDGLFSWS